MSAKVKRPKFARGAGGEALGVIYGPIVPIAANTPIPYTAIRSDSELTIHYGPWNEGVSKTMTIPAHEWVIINHEEDTRLRTQADCVIC